MSDPNRSPLPLPWRLARFIGGLLANPFGLLLVVGAVCLALAWWRP